MTSRSEWDNWLSTNSAHTPFTQSSTWGEILMSEGKQIERLVVLDNEQWVAVALTVTEELPFRWQYAFCPKGPVVAKGSEGQTGEIYETLLEYYRQRRDLFFRCEPTLVLPALASRARKTIDINPRATTIVDLQKTEVELLALMHQKTRYNINLAIKKGLVIKTGKNWEAFWPLMQATGKRDSFRLHHVRHYRVIFDSPFSIQLTAWLGEVPVATMIGIGFGDTFTYVFGASDYAYRSSMAPQLLQWEAMRLAKQSGYRWYDFYGIAPSDSPKSKACLPDRQVQSLPTGQEGPKSDEYMYDTKHQYAGVTRFKLGFGGIISEQPGTFDVILRSKTYKLYQLLRKVRRMF